MARFGWRGVVGSRGNERGDRGGAHKPPATDDHAGELAIIQELIDGHSRNAAQQESGVFNAVEFALFRVGYSEMMDRPTKSEGGRG